MRPAYLRALVAPAALVIAIALAGCDANDVAPSGRALAPLSDKMIATLAEKNMDKESPILARIFKEDSEMEVWKKNRDGEFALLKTYPICRWSGDLGPKKREGDRQAPEGFYTITPGQMNPKSNYYLAFNTGFPNAYDRAWGYTGSELMVHGDCSSRGCYAMTDEQIQEIYALARESFYGGQKEFQLQAFPFRMTALNMAKHRNNPNFAFWKMLKEGYDDFEATHQEPKVAVCEKRYVFDAAPPENSDKPLKFDPRGKCPVYQTDPAVAGVVLDHRRDEQTQMANYIARNVSTVPLRHGIDGGMNPVFAAKLGNRDNGGVYQVAASGMEAPGALPRTASVAPPAKSVEPAPAEAGEPVVMASVPMPTPAPQAKVGTAPPEKTASMGGLLDSLFAPSAPKPAENAAVAASAPQAKPKPVRAAVAAPMHARTAPPKAVARAVPEPEPRPETKAARKSEPPAPEVRTAFSAPQPRAATLPGAQPVVPAGSFDARWSALR